jgi:hypothetical protein
MINFSDAALACIDETGIDPDDDLAAVERGDYDRASLLAYCLDGADPDRAEGWRDYVSAIFLAAGKEG